MTDQQHNQCIDIKMFIEYLKHVKKDYVNGELTKKFYSNSQDYSEAGRQLANINGEVINTFRNNVEELIKRYEELFAKI